MAGYLDEYGVAEARREHAIKYIVAAALIVLVAAGAAFLFFRNRAEERVIDRFLAALRDKRYQEAYAMWGCTQQKPCPYYSPEKFTEDWGPSGSYKNPEKMKIENVDACGTGADVGTTGAVFDISYPGADDQGLWVDRQTKIISYAPWARCPGPHLQIIEFLKSRFGGGSK